MREVRRRKLIKDAVVVALSIIVAVLIAKSPALGMILSAGSGFYILETFIAGLFFTSVFTTVPAMVVLGALTTAHSPYLIAVIGGLGAVAGDLVIFGFLKKHVSDDISDIIVHSKSGHMRHLLKYKFARWSLVLLGALVIASPFPDELGLTLMGLSKISRPKFALISFVFNALGILAIAAVAQASF
ncbi:MAG TPA: hypothetical protein VHD69_00990 [Candidatus Paceibacterota bacterium]|jgi:uncharacterized membrane protein YdjX (TVP38/TMEM64 family)|nr:hypothetical protein [Candidatus Paceibacterota bacterium]